MSKQNEISVVSHSQTPEFKLNRNTLRAMFSMHLQVWPDGSAVTVFVLADRNAIHQKFTKSQLRFFPYQLRRSWDKQVFSGTGDAPIVVKNIQQMKERVAETVGSIGYVPTNLLDEQVKKLEVE